MHRSFALTVLLLALLPSTAAAGPMPMNVGLDISVDDSLGVR